MTGKAGFKNMADLLKLIGNYFQYILPMYLPMYLPIERRSPYRLSLTHEIKHLHVCNEFFLQEKPIPARIGNMY